MRNYLKLNSVIAFEDVDTEKWEFEVHYETFIAKGSAETDQMAFSCRKNSCYFMTSELGTLNTFDSCPYNSRIVNASSLKEHKCQPCGNLSPISYGFSAVSCYECSSLKNSLEVEDESALDKVPDKIDKYAYKAGCLGGVTEDQND